MPETNSLTYRGYAVQDLCEECSFEEVAFLLWNGELPNAAQLEEFKQAEAAERPISDDPASGDRRLPARRPPDGRHPHRRVLPRHGGPGGRRTSPRRRSGARRCGSSPRSRPASPPPTAPPRARSRSQPDPKHSFAENLFHLAQGKVPQPEVMKSFDVSLILYAEHTFNASTFTARTVTSTGADIHGAVAAAIAALKGPLHGGANEAVMHMLTEIGEPSKARRLARRAASTTRRW